jgi:4-amino-4-deoxy-L-arabinose transferase-like glycosyltransferase
MQSSVPRAKLLLLVFLVALGVRLAYFTAVHRGPLGNDDSAEYEYLASRIIHHQTYERATDALGGFPVDLQRPPGYPMFLALVARLAGRGREKVAIAQIVLNASLALLLALFVGLLTTEFAGLCAGLLYATDWATIVFSPLSLAEPLFVFLLGIGLCLYALSLRYRIVILSINAGLLLGLAVLVKPIGQVVVFSFLLAWLTQKNRRMAMLLFLVSYGVSVAPWMMRNYYRHGIATVSAIGTVSLYFYTAQAAAHPHPIGELAGTGLTQDLARISNQWNRQPLPPAQRKQRMEREAWRLIRQNWPVVLRQSIIGFARTCFGTGFVTVSSSLPKLPSRMTRFVLAVLPAAQIVVLWALALLGISMPSLSPSGTSIRSLLAASVILLALPAASSVGQCRFRVPITVPLCVLGGMGTGKLRQQHTLKTMDRSA